MNEKDSKQLSWSAPSAEPIRPIETQAPIRESGMIPAAKLAGWIAVGIVAGIVIAWGVRNAVSKGSVNPAPAVTNATSTQPQQSSGASLTVMTPQKAGRSVSIAKAAVQSPTWVVVYESRNGTPGNVLGASLFFPEKQTGTVELLRGTVAGQTYFVTKHRDNGDRRFSLRADPLLEEDGQAVWTTFTAN